MPGRLLQPKVCTQTQSTHKQADQQNTIHTQARTQRQTKKRCTTKLNTQAKRNPERERERERLITTKVNCGQLVTNMLKYVA